MWFAEETLFLGQLVNKRYEKVDQMNPFSAWVDFKNF